MTTLSTETPNWPKPLRRGYLYEVARAERTNVTDTKSKPQGYYFSVLDRKGTEHRFSQVSYPNQGEARGAMDLFIREYNRDE
jgi:hypothetical protein